MYSNATLTILTYVSQVLALTLIFQWRVRQNSNGINFDILVLMDTLTVRLLHFPFIT